MSAYNTYPEFREGAGKQIYKADKADYPPHPPPPEPKKPDKVDPDKVDPVADLPPPSSKKQKLRGFYRDVVKAKAEGGIERMVQKSQLF